MTMQRINEGSYREVANGDGELLTDEHGNWQFAALDAEILAAQHGGRVISHADYPHEPGHLYGCQACEGACHCGPGVQADTETECVFEGEHNTVLADLESTRDPEAGE
jgi:hypothetical protein